MIKSISYSQDDLTNELWKPILSKLFEDRYRISNLGRICSEAYKLTDSLGRTYCKKSKLLKISKDSDGYSIIGLSKNGLSKTFKIHFLVASAFIPNLLSKPAINHLNGIKADNRACNLEWCTSRENIVYSFKILGRIGYSVKGAQHSSSKRVKQFTKTGKLRTVWPSMGEIERTLGFDVSSICKVCKGKKKSYKGFIWRYEDDKKYKL